MTAPNYSPFPLSAVAAYVRRAERCSAHTASIVAAHVNDYVRLCSVDNLAGATLVRFNCTVTYGLCSAKTFRRAVERAGVKGGG